MAWYLPFINSSTDGVHYPLYPPRGLRVLRGTEQALQSTVDGMTLQYAFFFFLNMYETVITYIHTYTREHAHARSLTHTHMEAGHMVGVLGARVRGAADWSRPPPGPPCHLAVAPPCQSCPAGLNRSCPALDPSPPHTTLPLVLLHCPKDRSCLLIHILQVACLFQVDTR